MPPYPITIQQQEVAVKVIDKGQLNQASMSKLSREVSLMKQLTHPNIVKLYEVIESERHVYLVMEFACNGGIPRCLSFFYSQDLRERVLRGKYRIPFYMSTDCEMLLKKMLVLNPEKRCSLLAVMEDKWTNIGFEEDILKPYSEPPPNYTDPTRLVAVVPPHLSPDSTNSSDNSTAAATTTARTAAVTPSTHPSSPLKSPKDSTAVSNTGSSVGTTTTSASHRPVSGRPSFEDGGPSKSRLSAQPQTSFGRSPTPTSPFAVSPSPAPPASAEPPLSSRKEHSPPSATLGVRRTHTFTSSAAADRRATTATSHRLGHGNLEESTKALVRAPNVANIVSQKNFIPAASISSPDPAVKRDPREVPETPPSGEKQHPAQTGDPERDPWSPMLSKKHPSRDSTKNLQSSTSPVLSPQSLTRSAVASADETWDGDGKKTTRGCVPFGRRGRSHSRDASVSSQTTEDARHRKQAGSLPQPAAHSSRVERTSWGQKPRKITFPRKSRMTGNDPTRLINEVIAALIASQVEFLRLGDYRLNFVYHLPPVAPASDGGKTAPPASTPLAALIESKSAAGAGGKRSRALPVELRVGVEVNQYFGTNTYALRFKQLSGETRAYKAVVDSLVKLIKT
nr:unnamed protein product [Spirometra erinaceieuropaei]